MQISLITMLIDRSPVFSIIVAILAGLGRLDIFPDNTDLLFGLLDNIQTDERSFPSF